MSEITPTHTLGGICMRPRHEHLDPAIAYAVRRTDPVNAALENGFSTHVFDWDDTILSTRAHLGAALLPPLLAAGEMRGWTLEAIIPAFAVGFEVTARINEAVIPRSTCAAGRGRELSAVRGLPSRSGECSTSGPRQPPTR